HDLVSGHAVPKVDARIVHLERRDDDGPIRFRVYFPVVLALRFGLTASSRASSSLKPFSHAKKTRTSKRSVSSSNSSLEGGSSPMNRLTKSGYARSRRSLYFPLPSTASNFLISEFLRER